MTKNIVTVLTAIVLYFAVNQNVEAGVPEGAVFLDGGNSRYALILCHGRGKHPKWKVVNPLRIAVHQELGWHTLSLQMPAGDKNWKMYANDFPEAFRRIDIAIQFLVNEKKVEAVFLMGHSMGARMASAFMADDQASNSDGRSQDIKLKFVKGLIVAGIRNNGGHPLDGKANLEKVRISVLDIWGDGGDSKDSQHASERRGLVSEHYKQVSIKGADHKFNGYESQFLDQVLLWLKLQKG